MDKRLKSDYLWEKEQICKVFKGMSIMLYKYDIDSHEIIFSSNNGRRMHEEGLPSMISLRILCDWWFESKIEWKKKLSNVQPCFQESVDNYALLSYELTLLMNKYGATINSVQFNEEDVNIIFECGKKIAIPFYAEIDYAWVIDDYHSENGEDGWSATCEDGELFVNIPK